MFIFFIYHDFEQYSKKVTQYAVLVNEQTALLEFIYN